MDSVSTEDLFEGTLRMKQPRAGYRYTIDPVLVAHFVRPTSHARIMDLGTGSGIIPLILCHRYPNASIWGIEIQGRLADLAKCNVSENGLEHRITIVCGDMTRRSVLPKSGSMDMVLSNPPYIPCRAGRLNPDKEKAIARHEIHVTLAQVISTAWYLLKESGRFALILPSNRLDELIMTLEAQGFTPQTLRLVHPLPGSFAKRVLVESLKGNGAGLETLPPLTIFTQPGIYSVEVKNMFD